MRKRLYISLECKVWDHMEIGILASANNSDTAALPDFVSISVSSAVKWL